MLFSSKHRRACEAKQQERLNRIKNLSPVFHEPLSYDEKVLLRKPVSQLVMEIQATNSGGEMTDFEVQTSSAVLIAYGKAALKAHAETNCLTEVMISAAETWAKECNKQGPLAGIPISLKDTVGIEGWDSCIGYSAWVGKPMQKDSTLVQLLRDAGAIPFVKTTIPITLLSYESTSDVFGVTTNPHKKGYSPGGSSGGEAALLACGGSRIGIGTDVAGSVRVPSHYSGTYTIKASAGRFLKMGSGTSIAGQEGVAPVYSPMARTLEDLETVWKAVMQMKPWEYDHSVLPLPWRKIDLEGKKLKWGVLWDDGVVAPSPACERALRTVVDSLESHGYEVVTIDPPSPYEALKLGAQLLLADALKTVMKPVQAGETNDPGVRQALKMFALPLWFKRTYASYIRRIRGDVTYAGLVENCNEKTVEEFWALVAAREKYKARWFSMWKEEELDFVLTVPNALPAVPHGGMKEGWKACGYSFLFNILDYSAGVLPITKVKTGLDQLPSKFKARNAIEAGNYKMYDPHAMDGLPVGVQIVGKRLEEEKVMEGMKIIEKLLKQDGKAYELLEIF